MALCVWVVDSPHLLRKLSVKLCGKSGRKVLLPIAHLALAKETRLVVAALLFHGIEA
jgi:hypothetical protein